MAAYWRCGLTHPLIRGSGNRQDIRWVSYVIDHLTPLKRGGAKTTCCSRSENVLQRELQLAHVESGPALEARSA